MVLLAKPNACHAYPVALLLIVAARSLDVCDALDNGAGRTPPMGWGCWIQHHIAPTAAILKKAADDMVDVGPWVLFFFVPPSLGLFAQATLPPHPPPRRGPENFLQ